MAHGCFYRLAANASALQYLPQVGLDARATILSSNSRTVITQTFVNPSSTEAISEVFYSFPLYESSSIVGFTCHLGDTVIEGIVKPKEKANEIYEEAKSKGKTAAILDRSVSAADVFSTRLGNVPAGGTVLVEITLIQELIQDAKTDGVRYTIPATIGPRYGTGVGVPHPPEGLLEKTAIKVDVVMEKGSKIRNIRSPSHPIEVDLGRTADMPESTFESNYASIKLRENVTIDKDFVITVNADKQDLPFAFLETHPTLPNQKALMVSLVPKFTLPPDASEIVFVIDRSGSMMPKTRVLRSALELFLKSLPLGVPFNLISFGSSSEALWARSKVSTRESLEEALRYTKRIRADLGGTEIMCGLERAVEQRYQDKVLEVLVLTDGEVWNQSEVFDLVNKANQEHSARFFTLGLGDSVSHSLINGISRAGKGFTQTVLNNEDLNKTVVRMLKGALMPRLHNSRLDVDVSNFSVEEDFVKVELPGDDTTDTEPSPKKISLFNQDHKEGEGIGDVCEPLPKIAVPSILQAPHDLPALFPFIRSNIYLLLSQSIGSFPETITLRANSKHGLLELEIPVQDIGKGQTVHQLAAKKTITELEESRGWIYSAKNAEGELIKTKWESRVDELVKTECERLGVRFQVAGKHCSFVAVSDEAPAEHYGKPKHAEGSPEIVASDALQPPPAPSGFNAPKPSAFNLDLSAMGSPDIPQNFDFDTFLNPDNDTAGFEPKSKKAKRSHTPRGPSMQQLSSQIVTPYGATSAGYSPMSSGPTAIPLGGSCSGYCPPTSPGYSPTSPGFFSPTSPRYSPTSPAHGSPISPNYSPTSPTYNGPTSPWYSSEPPEEDEASTLPLNKVIQLQNFEGYWEMSDELLLVVSLDPSTARVKVQTDIDSLAGTETKELSAVEKWSRLIATSLVCRFLETREAESHDVWELIKVKADGWVQAEIAAMDTTDRELVTKLIERLVSLF
ncbi:von Willebrand factor, type A [Penicillium griseofulvum]|uniref:von Willebrand factor, type A n=1 Tax=Penicillium patulum TaxID=5078 RepID=A0A135LL23_PENPA|nr:von Willebrand factor, type A [Penicillium griseofulvum]KXG49672.1 von Willebrand factor, type A [Penicillium griseofulvum]